MSKNTPKFIRNGVILAVLLIFGGYIAFNTRIFISGPQISLSSPLNGSLVSENSVIVEGQTINTSYISINDRAISIDEQGNFKESVMLQRGQNFVVIKAHDKFDRQVTRKLDLVYNIEESQI
jgi:hypothetical protein